MTFQFRALAEQAQADGHITADEILALRCEGWADGRMGAAEAEAIFVLNGRLVERGTEWVDFFVEALTEFVLAGGTPRGFVSEEQADWLIARIDQDGQVEALAELELLAHLFDRAERIPARLKEFALTRLERLVLADADPARDGGETATARITGAQCRLLRRILFAFAGDTAAGVSQAEAELLFRLKDATLGADNAPEWQTLFVQGVANYLMAYNHFEQLAPDRAVQLEAFMNAATPRVGGFFGRMAGSGWADGFAEVGRVLGFGRKGADAGAGLAAAVAADEAVTEQENAWLQQQIDANGQLDALEKALLRFIAAQGRR